MKHLRTLTIAVLFLLPNLLSSQAFDYVTGYGFNTEPGALVPLTGGRWLSVCVGNPIPGAIFQDTVVAVVFNSEGEILFQKRLDVPVSEVHSVQSAIGTPEGGFAISVSGQDCDTGPHAISILVFDADANLKWQKNGTSLPLLLKISPGGDLVGLNSFKSIVETYNLETGAVISTFTLYDNGTFFYIYDFDFFTAGNRFIAVGYPDLQRWEKLDSSTYYLSDLKKIDPLVSSSPYKIIRDSIMDGYRYTFDRGKRLYIFEPSSLEVTLFGDYPFRFIDLVSTASNLIALVENDSSSFLVNINFQGAIIDTIRIFPPLLKGVNLSYQNNVLAIAGINSSGPRINDSSWIPFNRHQLWLHTEHLNDGEPAEKPNVALTQVAQNTYLTVDSTYSSWADAYRYSFTGGQFRVQIKNEGETVLESLDVNIGFDWVEKFICSYRPAIKKHYSGLGLLPNESTWLEFGDVQADGQPFAPSELCFWTSAPNHKPDAEPGDDVFCKSFISTSASEPVNRPFSVLPNPANASILVSFRDASAQGSWKIFDMTGRQVKAGETESAAQEMKISTVDFVPGLYVLWVNGSCLKIVIEH